MNAVVQFARKYKSEQIDTIFCFDKVEPDDGGLADYYKAMTDHDAFAVLNDDPAEDDFDDSEEYDVFHDKWRVFAKDFEKPNSELPEDTTQRRCFKKWLLDGKKTGAGAGGNRGG